MGIDILIPVLGRAQLIAPLADNIHQTTDTEHRIVFLCSPDDAATQACQQTGERTEIMEWAAGHADYAKKMQHGFDLTDSEHVFLGATDIEFTAGWDRHVLRHGDKGVVGTNDHANTSVRRGKFGTHCLVSRRYVTEQGGSADGPGHLFHQGYDHNFVDRELCALAQARNEWAFSKRAVVRHRHMLWKTAPDDPTYQKALRHFHRDRQLFLRRARLWGGAGVGEHERDRIRRSSGGRRRRVI